jgi:anti-anti-sigma factor
MSIRVSKINEDIWRIALAGRIDGAVSRAVEEAFNNLAESGHHRVVVDFTEATYLASAGIRVLIMAQRRAQTAGGGVQLAAAITNIEDVMRMAGLEQMFVFNKSVGEAIGRLMGGGTEEAE